MVSLSSHETVKTGNRPRAPLPPLALSPTAVAAAPLPEEPEMCKENQCIPYAFKPNGFRGVCAQSYQDHNCFPPTAVEMEFYEKINWPKLRRIIDTEMTNFKNLLNVLYINNHDGFADLVNLVYPGIISRVDGNGLFFKAADLVKEQQHPCNDVNYSFSIECQRHIPGGRTAVSDSGAIKEFRLFHIAIHSEMPKYHKKDEGRTRSQYACGYFERKQLTDNDRRISILATEGAVAAGVEGSGPFHYKIDNYDILSDRVKAISSSQCGNKIDEIQCPFKRFEPEIEIGGATGKFQVLHGDNVGFVNLFAPWCTAVSFSPRFQENAGLQTRFAHLHSYIYNKFVTFWNDEIFPKVDSQRIRSVHKILPVFKKSKMVSVRKYTSKGRGGSRKRNAKRRITKKMKNSRRRVKKMIR
jgi:hypothetical protein